MQLRCSGCPSTSGQVHVQLHELANGRQLPRNDKYTPVADVARDPLCFLQCSVRTLPAVKSRCAQTIAPGFSKLHGRTSCQRSCERARHDVHRLANSSSVRFFAQETQRALPKYPPQGTKRRDRRGRIDSRKAVAQRRSIEQGVRETFFSTGMEMSIWRLTNVCREARLAGTVQGGKQRA